MNLGATTGVCRDERVQRCGLSDGSSAWFLALDLGLVTVNFKTVTYYVWPVRGGQ